MPTATFPIEDTITSHLACCKSLNVLFVSSSNCFPNWSHCDRPKMQSCSSAALLRLFGRICVSLDPGSRASETQLAQAKRNSRVQESKKLLSHESVGWAGMQWDFKNKGDGDSNAPSSPSLSDVSVINFILSPCTLAFFTNRKHSCSQVTGFPSHCTDSGSPFL